MRARHPFVALEGLSGSGKTTVGRRLAERLGAHFYVTPPEPYRRVRGEIDAARVLPARYLFYLSALFHASREIGELRASRPVVCDRWALTTECFHRAAGLPIPFCHLDLPLERPTLQVLIVTPEPERIARLVSRGLSMNDEWERADDLEHRLLAQYRCHDLVEVGNGSADPADAAHAVLGLLAEGSARAPRRCRPRGWAAAATPAVRCRVSRASPSSDGNPRVSMKARGVGGSPGARLELPAPSVFQCR
jgi:thymidylate kinase